MLLIEFVQNNPVLLLGTFLVLFAVSLGFYNNPLLAEIAIAGAPRSLFRVLRWPSAVLLRAHRHKRHLFLTLNFVFICLFCLVTFLYLRQTQSLAWAVALFLPLALLCMHALYYLLWICTYLVHAGIDVGNKKFNLMFSLTTIELLLIYLALPAAGRISGGTFGLVLFNLFLCYSLTAMAMKMVLKETLRQTTTFTHHNLWKVALTLLTEFLFELTFFCYSGACYFAQAYSVPVSLFDAFYFVVISFGTTGYGDIVPRCAYSKLVSILITFTSMTCIGIMFSSFLSAASVKKQ